MTLCKSELYISKIKKTSERRAVNGHPMEDCVCHIVDAGLGYGFNGI
jgi:hypothetical protein